MCKAIGELFLGRLIRACLSRVGRGWLRGLDAFCCQSTDDAGDARPRVRGCAPVGMDGDADALPPVYDINDSPALPACGEWGLHPASFFLFRVLGRSLQSISVDDDNFTCVGSHVRGRSSFMESVYCAWPVEIRSSHSRQYGVEGERRDGRTK
jgi:hypothetical protein